MTTAGPEALVALDHWLAEHEDRFASPFHPLAGFLRRSLRDVQDLPPMSPDEYALYMRSRTLGPGLPFRDEPLPELPRAVPIEHFIDALDRALLDRMVQDHLFGLLRYLSRRPQGCTFLEYGTGPTCGLHGQEHAELYRRAEIDVERITFLGIDKFLLPSGAVFPHSRYLQRDLLRFDPGERFDLVTAHHVLEHVREWRKLIAAAGRVLTRGGYAFLSFPAFGGFYDVLYRLLKREGDVDHVTTYELDDVISAAHESGLDLLLASPYADPRMRFFWLPSVDPTVTPELQSAVYDACVQIGARTRLFLHHYGHYVVFVKR